MAIKIKKKVDRPEEDPEAPDQVLVATRDTFDWLQENRTLVIVGIGVLLAGIIGVSVFMSSRHGRAVEASQALYGAFGTSIAAVGDEGEYDTLDARSEAVREQARAIASDGNAGLSRYASMMVGSASLWLGDAADGQASYGDALAGGVDGPDAILAQLGLAVASADNGDLDGALATLDEIDAAGESFGFVAAHTRAQVLDTYGAPSDALDAYRELRESYPDQGDGEVLDNRVMQLEIALGVEDEPELEPEATEEGGEEPEEGGE